MMKNEYRKIMDNISLSDKEQSEILAQAEGKAHKSKSYLKPILAGVCVLLFVFMGYKMNQSVNVAEPDTTTLIQNPMQRYDDVETASEAIGFMVTVPVLDNIDGIFIINGEIIQIKGQYEGQEITFRMGKGSDDISGDFNKYEQEKTLMVNGSEITVKGNDDLILMALWQWDDFTYSINAEGLSEDNVMTLIESMTTTVK